MSERLLSSLELIPAFSSPISVIQLDHDFSGLESLVRSTEYSAMEDGANISVSQHLLAEKGMEIHREALLRAMVEMKDSVFHYIDLEIDITTSWATKVTPPSTDTSWHNHQNSLWSGVLYFDQYQGGSLQFMDFSGRNAFLIEPREQNLYNCQAFEIPPNKNQLVVFPSYLYHRIREYTGSDTRYSFAFNVFPKGQFGMSDSRLNLNLL